MTEHSEQPSSKHIRGSIGLYMVYILREGIMSY